MNSKSLIVLSLGLCTVQAHAQVELKSGPLVPSPSFIQTTGALPLTADPSMPGLPNLTASGQPRLIIREIDSYRGRFYQLEAVRQGQGEILEAIGNAMGVRVNIQPVLRLHRYQTRVLRAFRLEDLLIQAAQSDGDTNMVKSANGTYSFTENTSAKGPMFIDLRRYMPIIEGRPVLRASVKPIEPKVPPHSGAFPFNGRNVYIIPVPSQE
jgi:hypothetical protein